MQSNPHNFTLYGMALLDEGLVVQDGISGVGLLTRGLIFTAGGIWFDPQKAAPITTVWANSNPSVTTSWTDSNPVVTTTWHDPIQGLSGEVLE